MSVALVAASLWVLAATVVAFLPMRRQYVPGMALLIAAPGVILWLGMVHGGVAAVIGLAGFVSMFRKPLRYLWKRARGEAPELPPELRGKSPE